MLDGSATQNKQFSYSSDKELANLTREQYNNFGWVRANDVISAGYWKNFTSKYASAVNSKHHFEKTKDGEYMIPAYDEYDTSGIEDVVVFASGSIDNPNVTKIVKIDSIDETEILYGLFSSLAIQLLYQICFCEVKINIDMIDLLQRTLRIFLYS